MTGRLAGRAARLPAPQPDLFAGAARGRSARAAAAAVLAPSRARPKLPVLLDPYGGPHAQRVLAAQGAFLTSQWLADQGFAVVVADGRGTPGRGPGLGPRGLARPGRPGARGPGRGAARGRRAAAPTWTLSRVAIRGWSFGGYLAALAVLRRPDVFHAAVAGAPVTDWRLYDTHYTERYLGAPGPEDAGRRTSRRSLLARRAAGLSAGRC